MIKINLMSRPKKARTFQRLLDTRNGIEKLVLFHIRSRHQEEGIPYFYIHYGEILKAEVKYLKTLSNPRIEYKKRLLKLAAIYNKYFGEWFDSILERRYPT